MPGDCTGDPTADINSNHSSTSGSKVLNRLAIWSVPRSLSTVLTRCISMTSNKCQVYFEYYGTACCFGPEKVCCPPSFKGQPPKQPEYTYEWVKQTLEGDHPDQELVILKDIAYAARLEGQFDMIPKGYKHTFIIRHPAKVFRSMAVMIKEMPFPIRSYLPKSACIFQELLELHQHVTSAAHQQQSIIIDADDLIAKPAETLRLYCEAVGVSFSPDMLKWDPCNDPPTHWNMSPTFRQMTSMLKVHHHAYQSTGIDNYNNAGSDHGLDMSKLSPEIQNLTEVAMPSYLQLYEKRLRP